MKPGQIFDVGACMSASGCRLLSLMVIAIVATLTSEPVRAENLDQGKSGATLFTTTCASCHSSPRGLVKDRFSWALSSYLRLHYTSNAGSAQLLTAYLQSVDAPRGKTQPQLPVRSAAAPLLRPPAPVSVR